MKLEFPQKKHKKAYEELIKEWGKIESLNKVSPGALFKGNNFDEFLYSVKKRLNNPGERVKAILFLLIENENILGAIQIRYHINSPKLIEKGGHIGYGITPKFRRKGYATKMLELGFIEAKKMGLENILITCDSDNIGSKKVIEKNGGVFERLTKDGVADRYWVEL